MSYFALLSPQDETDGLYAALNVHVNVWSLHGLFAHRPMIFDVGVLLRTQGRVKAIEMAIPARASLIIDLSDLLLRGDIAALIFSRLLGEHNAKEKSFQLQGHGWVKIGEINDRGEGTRIVHSDDHLTAVRLQLAGNGLEPDKLAYIRVRFAIDHAGRLWRWERVLGRRNGVLIDFRSPGSREERSRRERRPDLEDRAIPLDAMDVFMMLPSCYQLRNATPPLLYTRTLEGSSWDAYLRRSAQGILRREHLMVHHWRREREIRPDAVFRGFLQFNREPAFRAVTDLLIGAVVALGLAYILLKPLTPRSGVEDMIDGVGNAATYLTSHYVPALIGVGIITLAG